MSEERTIVILGVFDVLGSTNIPMATSFMKMGFKVIPINYRTIIRKKGLRFFEGLIGYTMGKHKPFLTMFCKCNGISSDIVSMCNKHSITWLFNPDGNSPPLERWPEVTEHAVRANFSSCTGGSDVEWFKSKGANCFHIIQGVDPTVFRPIEPSKEYKADISFIGTKTTERDFFKNLLESNNINAKFYGSGYATEVVEDEFAKVCSSSKFMLSLNTLNNVFKKSFSNRLMRYLSCEVCTFHYDNTETLKDIFEDGKELIIFKTPEELINKINNISDVEAKEIAISGRKRVLRDYTWDCAIKRILAIVGVEDNEIF